MGAVDLVICLIPSWPDCWQCDGLCHCRVLQHLLLPGGQRGAVSCWDSSLRAHCCLLHRPTSPRPPASLQLPISLGELWSSLFCALDFPSFSSPWLNEETCPITHRLHLCSRQEHSRSHCSQRPSAEGSIAFSLSSR